MEAYSKDYFKRLERDIMFDISDEEAGELQYEFQDLLKQIKALDAIDTEHVEEMVYPFETETHYLREDEVNCVISQEEALCNAKSVKAGHVHVPKVVK